MIQSLTTCACGEIIHGDEPLCDDCLTDERDAFEDYLASEAFDDDYDDYDDEVVFDDFEPDLWDGMRSIGWIGGLS